MRCPVPEPLAETLRRLHREATPGPWRDAMLGGLRPGEGKIIAVVSGEGDEWRPVAYFCDNHGQGEASDVEGNRPLIVTLRNALPALADIVAEVEANHEDHAVVPIDRCRESLCRSLAALREQLGKR